jgi:chromosomal replication initiator protein
MTDISFPTEQDKTGRHFNLRSTFSEFVVGTGNQFAHAASIAAADQPGDTYNPLFIYGSVGLGKTHLASAIGHRLESDGEGLRRVIFMSAENFTNELIASLKANQMGEFQAKFRSADALILDDVEFLAGSERTQEELFHTFDSLHAAHHQIVLTSDMIPRDIPGLEERLRNRFECGLTADIAAPDLETRVAILEKKAAYDDFVLPSEVAQYVARNIFSNVRELEGCLNRLVALSSVNHCTITLEFAHEALRDLIPPENSKIGIETVQKAVAVYFNVRLIDLMSKRRTQHLALCRQVAMYLCRQLTDSSFPAIGERFGRDHSTVIHAHNLIAHRVIDESPFRELLDKLGRELKKGAGKTSKGSFGTERER